MFFHLAFLVGYYCIPLLISVIGRELARIFSYLLDHHPLSQRTWTTNNMGNLYSYQLINNWVWFIGRPSSMGTSTSLLYQSASGKKGLAETENRQECATNDPIPVLNEKCRNEECSLPLFRIQNNCSFKFNGSSAFLLALIKSTLWPTTQYNWEH